MEEILSLASSLATQGQLVPVRVRLKDEKYQLVFGHRRLKAARHIGWNFVDADIVDMSDEQVACASLVENFERRNLSDYETAMALKRMNSSLGLTLKQLGSVIGYSESHVSNLIRMSEMFDEETLAKNTKLVEYLYRISEHHARLLLTIPNLGSRKLALQMTLEQQLSVRDLQRIIHRLRAWFPSDSEKEVRNSHQSIIFGSDRQTNDIQNNIFSQKFKSSYAPNHYRTRSDARRFRIAVAGFGAESNAFSLEVSGDDSVSVLDSSAILSSPSGKVAILEGIIDTLQEKKVEVVPILKVFWKDGTVVSEASYQRYKTEIIGKMKKCDALDGILLDLHGAMKAEITLDPEGELLRELKDVVGDSVPIVCTLDLHANLTDLKFNYADLIFGCKSNPHIDLYETGVRAAQGLIQILEGSIDPHSCLERIQMIGHNVGMSTWAFDASVEEKLPLRKIMLESTELLAARNDLIDISIFIGFPQGDAPEAVVTVLVTGNGIARDSMTLAHTLAKMIWDSRYKFLTVRPMYSVEEGVIRAIGSPTGPVVLVDLGDNAGGGSACDSNVILKELLGKQARDAVVPIRDPEAVKKAFRLGVDGEDYFELGGLIDSRFCKPIRIKAKVKTLSDGRYFVRGPSDCGYGKRKLQFEPCMQMNVGRLAVLLCERIEIIITEGRVGMERDFYKAAGIDPSERKIVVVKSHQAHRASFEGISSGILELDTPGVTNPSFRDLSFRNIGESVFPLNDRTGELLLVSKTSPL